MAEVEPMNREFIRSQKGHGCVTAQRAGNLNLIKRLSKRLITDFSPHGDHAGEFGRTASAVEQGRWAAGGPDRVDVKPWYYLTYWAVRGLFLSDPDCLTDFSTIIILNIERRRTGKRWLQVLVDRSAAYDTMPGESEQIVVKSYRHTIRGANIVTILDPQSRIAWQVLADIIDPELKIQNKDGGWPQADKVYTSSDLWTTAYVLRFLTDFCARHKPESKTRDGVTGQQIQTVTQKTLAYVADEWAKSNWVYREMPSKAVVPKFLVEIAGLTDWSASPITQAVVDHCLAQLTLGGRIRNEREIEENDISELQQLIRIGFALQQMNASARLGLDTMVQQIRENVLSMVNDSVRLGPEDVAFCIHLAMEGNP